MSLYRLSGKTPQVPESACVAVEATLIGRVSLGDRASVWAGALVRGSPAIVKRALTDTEVANLIASADGYAKRAVLFQTELERVG